MSTNDLLTTERAAEVLGVSESFLRKARITGDGPTFVRIAPGRIVYDPADLTAWVEARKHKSTSEYPAVSK